MKLFARLLCVFAWITMQLFPAHAQQQLSPLSTSGTHIVTENHQQVQLHGMNLGQWVLMEGFMSGSNGNMSQAAMKRKLYDNGSSRQEIEALFAQWRANYITQADIDAIASKGYNVVRLPMHYEMFLTEQQLESRLDVIYSDIGTKEQAYNNYKDHLAQWAANSKLAVSNELVGFQLIDQLIEWCEKNYIYVILDMHAVPGTAGDNTPITDEMMYDFDWGGGDLYVDQRNRTALTAIWDGISKRYKNEPTICMYELVNEPHKFNGNGDLVELSNYEMTQLKMLYNDCIESIRANDDATMILLSGDQFGNDYGVDDVTLYPSDFTHPEHLVYGLHRYRADNDPNATSWNSDHLMLLGNAVNFSQAHQVPLFCGETGLDDNYDRLRENLANMTELGIGWALWTWKHHKDGTNEISSREERCPADIPGGDPWDDLDAWYSGELFNSIRWENCVVNSQAACWEAIAPRYTLETDVPFKIYNYKTTKALTADQAVNDNSNVYQNQFIASDAQLWNLAYDVGWTLTSAQLPQYLQIDGGSDLNNANAIAGLEQSSYSQWWIEWLGHGYKMENKGSNLLLEVQSGLSYDGANAQQWGNASQPWNTWLFVPVYTLNADMDVSRPNNRNKSTLHNTIINQPIFFDEPTSYTVLNTAGQVIQRGTTTQIIVEGMAEGCYFVLLKDHHIRWIVSGK